MNVGFPTAVVVLSISLVRPSAQKSVSLPETCRSTSNRFGSVVLPLPELALRLNGPGDLVHADGQGRAGRRRRCRRRRFALEHVADLGEGGDVAAGDPQHRQLRQLLIVRVRGYGASQGVEGRADGVHPGTFPGVSLYPSLSRHVLVIPLLLLTTAAASAAVSAAATAAALMMVSRVRRRGGGGRGRDRRRRRRRGGLVTLLTLLRAARLTPPVMIAVRLGRRRRRRPQEMVHHVRRRSLGVRTAHGGMGRHAGRLVPHDQGQRFLLQPRVRQRDRRRGRRGRRGRRRLEPGAGLPPRQNDRPIVTGGLLYSSEGLLQPLHRLVLISRAFVVPPPLHLRVLLVDLFGGRRRLRR